MEVTLSNEAIICALMDQVGRAVPLGGNENDVVTYISKPFYQLWLAALGEPFTGNSPIYGSQTIVVTPLPGNEFLSYSRARRFYE